MRLKSTFLPAALVLTLLTAGAARAQDFFATVTAVNGNRVTLNAGTDADLEVGDILVVQSGGFKKGLVRVLTASRESAVAETVRVEPGGVFARGDLAAYQLLQTGASRLWSAAPQSRADEGYRRDTGSAAYNEELPPWMGDEAPSAAGPSMQTGAYSDLDSQISAQKDILAGAPSDRRALQTLADLYFQKGWYDQSIAWNQRAVEASPDAPDNDRLYYQIATAYANLGNIEKRDIYMKYLRERCPESVFAHENPAPAPRVSAFSQPLSLRETAGATLPTSSIHGTPGTANLGAGATIKRLATIQPEARKGKIKILPIKKSGSEETNE